MSNMMKAKRHTQRKNVTRSLEIKSKSSEDVIGKRTQSTSVECDKKNKKCSSARKYSGNQKIITLKKRILSNRKEIGIKPSTDAIAVSPNKQKPKPQHNILNSQEKAQKLTNSNEAVGLNSPDVSGQVPLQLPKKKSSGDAHANTLRKSASNNNVNNNIEEEDASEMVSKKTLLDDKSWERCENDSVKITSLKKWVDTKILGGIQILKAEFKAVSVDVSADDCKMFYKHCESNRYPNVPCIDKTRVILFEEDKLYIHANRVRACARWDRFVCTQGPLPSTINDFWKTVQSLQVTFIVMLCAFTESGTVKCARYYPEAGSSMETETFTISTESTNDWNIDGEHSTDKVFQSKLKYVNRITGKEGRITHYQWCNWPDHGTPESCDTTLKLLAAVRRSRTPTIVHCSAGVGRTGTFVLVESIIQSLCNPKHGNVNECFSNLRKDRARMVQTLPQYVYAIRCALEYFIAKGCPKNEDQWIAYKEQVNKFLGGKKKRSKPTSKRKKVGSCSAEEVEPIPTPQNPPVVEKKEEIGVRDTPEVCATVLPMNPVEEKEYFGETQTTTNNCGNQNQTQTQSQNQSQNQNQSLMQKVNEKESD